MNASQLRLWLAAPMASLFLVLSLCAFTFRKPESEGIYIPILRLHENMAEMICGDSRDVYIQLRASGQTMINSTEIPSGEVGPRLAKIMQHRFERIVFIVSDPGVPYGRFVRSLSAMQNSVDDLHIGVLSGQLGKEYLQKWAQPCRLIWPTAIPGLLYPEACTLKSTRPPGSGDLAQPFKGHTYPGIALMTYFVIVPEASTASTNQSARENPSPLHTSPAPDAAVQAPHTSPTPRADS